MPFSLADITRQTRVIAKYGGIALGILLFFYFTIKAIIWLVAVLNPPKVEPPEMRFGALENNLPVGGNKALFTYELNTITGGLPQYPDRIYVYKLKLPDPDLLALSKARDTVRRLGYTEDEKQLSQNVYEWKNTSGGKIVYDITSYNFELTSGIGFEDRAYTFNQPNGVIQGEALRFIEKLGADTSDIDVEKEGKTKFTFFSTQGTQLVPQARPEAAHIVKVDLYQTDIPVDPFSLPGSTPTTIEALPIFYEADTPNQTITLKAGSTYNLQVISGTYNHYSIDPTQKSTYPLKASQQAFSELQDGQGYILTNRTDTLIEITEVVLGYFIPKSPTLDASGNMYAMPIYVFKGRDFLAYINAVAEASQPE